jgi:hypothetical protein
VGGLFLRALYDAAVWKKYASRDQTKATQWAPLPAASKVGRTLPPDDRRQYIDVGIIEVIEQK